MAREEAVILGDIFRSKAHMLVVPCSTAGTVTSGIHEGLDLHGITLPRFTLEPGQLRVQPAPPSSTWTQVCFATSVANNKSSVQIIRLLGANLGALTRQSPVRTVAAPLLGAGAGGLTSTAAARALIDGFQSRAHPDAQLFIFVLEPSVFARVQQYLRGGERLEVESTVTTESVKDVELKKTKRLPPRRADIFISYSHKDRRWLDRLRVHLQPLIRDESLVVWDDTKIRAGTKWRDEIKGAIERARVAVLLVSADFLASEFIVKNELPPLLQAAEHDGAVILPVILGPCRFSRTESIAVFQAVNDPEVPMSTLKSARRDKVWMNVVDAIEQALANR